MGNLFKFKGQDDEMEKTVDVYCKCGAYLGKVVPGYMKTVQCYCGEVTPIEKPREFVTGSHFAQAALA